MNRKPNRIYPANKYNRNLVRPRRPFWLPASNFYILTVAVSIAFFFLIWGVFHDENEETPLVFAGIGASVILGGAVFLREVVLRKARNRYLLASKRLDENINHMFLHSAGGSAQTNKLTLQQNAAILKEIKRKSEAAKVLGKLSEGHFEVFEMCSEYLHLSANELKMVGVGSPRLAAMRLGRETVKQMHRFHLLQWAEIETRTLTREAKNHLTVSDKLETAQKALTILDSALQFYPNELHLTESKEAVNEFIARIKVSHWMEQAERSAFKGHYKRAVSHYQDALFYLERENIQPGEKEFISDQINAELKKIKKLEDKKLKKAPKLKKTAEDNYD